MTHRLPGHAGNRAASVRRRAGATFRVSAVVVLLWGGPAQAQTITVSDNPGTLTITSAVAGQDLTLVTNSSTTYKVGTLLRTAKITAELSTALPTGVTLRITLAAPSGATSEGPVTLTTVPQDVVTNVPAGLTMLLVAGLSITYELSSTLGAGVVALTSRAVTLRVVEI